MSDQTGPRDEQHLPAPRPESAPVPVERFDAPAAAHARGLTPERAAKIVRQSASARWVAFLGVVVVSLFVAAYYFYETGIPGVDNSSRLTKELAVQQVTDVTQGWTIFQTYCSRCHGVQGEGGIGPKLNDQAKLLTHLTPAYVQNVLTVGGRYVCGDPNSLMPVWSDQGNPPGPLNYRNIQELIAFLHPQDPAGQPVKITFQAVDPNTKQTVTTSTWADPGFTMPPNATPVPACWKDAFAAASPAASAGASPAASGAAGSPAPSGAAGSPAPSGAAGTPAPSAAGSEPQIKLAAQGVAFDQTDLTAPANQPFQLVFANNDAGIPHDVAIHKDSPTGETVWTGDIVNGVATKTYDVPALAPGTYGFVCTVHPNMTGTLTVK